MGKTVHSLKKPLGLQMKGSPYSMNQPLHGNAFIGAKVKAEQQGKDSFNVDGKTFPVKKDSSEGPEFVGALVAGAGKLLAKKAVSKIGGSIVKKGLAEVGAKAFGAGSDINSLVKDVPAGPKSKTGMGRALSTIGSSIKEGVRGLGEGIVEKAGGSPEGFGDKVKNYIGSLDLITKSNPDGSLRKETDKPSTSADSDKNITNTEVDLGKRNTEEKVGEDLGMAKLNVGTATQEEMNQYVKAKKQEVFKQNAQPEMKGPLNKLKNMCRR